MQEKQNVVANYQDIVNVRPFKGNGIIHNPQANQVNKLLLNIYIYYITKKIRKVSGIKTSHGRKMLPKVERKKKNMTISQSKIISQSCLFMHLIFVHFEGEPVKCQTLVNICIWIKMCLSRTNIFQFQLLKGPLLSLKSKHFCNSVIFMPNHTLKFYNVFLIHANIYVFTNCAQKIMRY